MTIGKVIGKVIDEWEKAKDSEYVKKPLTYALFETWKWADAYEIEAKGKRKKRPEKKKCKDCKWLSAEKNKLGMKCTCPDKGFGTPLAMWKQRSNTACRHFEEKGGEKDA